LVGVSACAHVLMHGAVCMHCGCCVWSVFVGILRRPVLCVVGCDVSRDDGAELDTKDEGFDPRRRA